MTLTERERHDAYEALQGAFGPRTDIVIAMLQPATELATRDDLAVARAELRSEMSELRTEMSDLRTELRTEMADLRTDVGQRISGMQATMEVRITDGFQHQTRSLLFMIMGSVLLLILAQALRDLIG